MSAVVTPSLLTSKPREPGNRNELLWPVDEVSSKRWAPRYLWEWEPISWKMLEPSHLAFFKQRLDEPDCLDVALGEWGLAMLVSPLTRTTIGGARVSAYCAAVGEYEMQSIGCIIYGERPIDVLWYEGVPSPMIEDEIHGFGQPVSSRVEGALSNFFDSGRIQVEARLADVEGCGLTEADMNFDGNIWLPAEKVFSGSASAASAPTEMGSSGSDETESVSVVDDGEGARIAALSERREIAAYAEMRKFAERRKLQLARGNTRDRDHDEGMRARIAVLDERRRRKHEALLKEASRSAES